jgi:hypothetical protein
MFANMHVQQMQQGLLQHSLDEHMQQQLGVIDCSAAAAAASAEGESAYSTASAGAMVQQCTVVTACFGSYTLMVVSERLQDAQEAASASAGKAAAHGSPVVDAVLCCAQQLLVELGSNLQQQLDLSQLPAVLAQLSATSAVPAANPEEQQQQQQQEVHSSELPRLRLIVPSRHASTVSAAGVAAGSSAA